MPSGQATLSQRQTVEAHADLGHGRRVGAVHREVGADRHGTLDEERHGFVGREPFQVGNVLRVGDAERRDRVLALAVDPQRAAACDQHRDLRGAHQQVGGTLGLSALVTVFSTARRHDLATQAGHLHGPALAQHAFTHGADMAFRAGAVFALFGLIVALVLIRVQIGQSPSSANEVPIA